MEKKLLQLWEGFYAMDRKNFGIEQNKLMKLWFGKGCTANSAEEALTQIL